MDFLNYLFGLLFYLNGYAVVLAAFAVCFLWVWRKEHRRGKLDFSDLISARGKVSLTKLLQLLGGMTGTWIVVKLTLTEKLTVDFLIAYLSYVGAIEAWSKFVAAKYGTQNPESSSDTSEMPMK